jgi:two-component system nitrogen regulation response regulator GlnG
VGGSHPLPVDVRIIAATNTDLGRAVEEGRFRRDLFYRLTVVPMRLPPLRERDADALLLARHFSARYSEKLRGRTIVLAKDAEPLLLAHSWPGNVRELQNVIQRVLLKLPGSRITAKDLAPLLPATAARAKGLDGFVAAMLDAPEPEGGRYAAARAVLEVSLIAGAMSRTKGNQRRAAAFLGMNRNTIRERMRILGLKSRGYSL